MEAEVNSEMAYYLHSEIQANLHYEIQTNLHKEIQTNLHQWSVATHQLISVGSHWIKLITWYKIGQWLSEGYKIKKPASGWLVYQRIMPLAEILSSKFHSCLWSSSFSANCSFFGQSFSLGHYPPMYQPPKIVCLLIAPLSLRTSFTGTSVRLGFLLFWALGRRIVTNV